MLAKHVAHPSLAAFRVQQKEPMQAPEAQLALEAQGSPGARAFAGAGVGVCVGGALFAVADGVPVTP